MIVANTLVSHQQQLEEVRTISDTKEYTNVCKLTASSEGQCNLVKSSRTGKLFVVKHLFSGKAAPGKLPQEAALLIDDIEPHPNVVRLFAVENAPQGRFKLWLEYCSGGDLHDQIYHLWDWGPRQWDMKIAPEIFALHVFVQLAQGFIYLHHGLRRDEGGKYVQVPNHKPIIHADVKPANILLRWDPSTNECGMPDVVLADFGASIQASGTGYGGTPGFMSPEVDRLYQPRRTDVVEHRRLQWTPIMTIRSDIYSFGVTMYMLMTSKFWPMGRQPRELTLRAEYESKYLKVAVQYCLVVEAAEREEFSHKGGLFRASDDMRRERDSLFARTGSLPKDRWRHPPPLPLPGPDPARGPLGCEQQSLPSFEDSIAFALDKPDFNP